MLVVVLRVTIDCHLEEIGYISKLLSLDFNALHHFLKNFFLTQITAVTSLTICSVPAYSQKLFQASPEPVQTAPARGFWPSRAELGGR